MAEVDPYKGIGRRITINSPECQNWIIQGILDTYGFRHEAAIRCFQKALSFNSNSPWAHYFIARNYAANYNNPRGMDYGKGYEHASRAMELAGELVDWEKALIVAQTHRFCWPVGSKPLEELHRNYANAMRPVYEKFGKEDPDIAAMFAESLMLLAPWKLWTKPPNSIPALPETTELVEVLEKGLEINPNHAGLCHFYIHAMELSPYPEKALPTANRLRSLYPNQGHLIHMPSHIDMWVGQYKEAIEINIKAVESDEEYKATREPKVEFYDSYRMHNYHLIVWASMFDGQYATAIKYAELAEEQLTLELVTVFINNFPYGQNFMESFATIPWHVLIRFGKWQEIIDRPIREDKGAYAGTVTTSYYARAIAFAVLGRFDEADEERKKFYDALHSNALLGRYMFKNIMHDPDKHTGILDIAEAVMNGEVEYHKGNYDKAFEYLHLAVKRDISLNYMEPWGWMVPARHVLGALLLEHKEPAKAEEIYREDLKQYKNNLWSLRGLYQALRDQGKNGEEVEEVDALYKKASVRADVKIGASCLCATKLCC